MASAITVGMSSSHSDGDSCLGVYVAFPSPCDFRRADLRRPGFWLHLGSNFLCGAELQLFCILNCKNDLPYSVSRGVLLKSFVHTVISEHLCILDGGSQQQS